MSYIYIMEKLIIEPVVGYMLKVMKSGVDITKFKDEFSAIRHGNYDDFLDLVKGSRPPMVVWQEGIIYNQDNVSQKTHCDFVALVLSGPSLHKFFNDCINEYGDKYLINDDDISNEVYGKVVLFEIGLRMHANNRKLIGINEKLVNVIDKLSRHHNISKEDTDKLQKGRQFINDIKHHNDLGYKRKFKSWTDGVNIFEEAYGILQKHNLIIT